MEQLVHYYFERMVHFLHENTIAIGTMATGAVVSESELHKHFTDYLTDPSLVDLVQSYIGIICTLGGFMLMVYTTFFKKKKSDGTDKELSK
jgi:hypothetical protein